MSNVLIIDDEENIRESLSDILADEGYHVLTAASAEQGLDSIRRDPPDLVLLDIWLPGLDGAQALKEIAKMGEAGQPPMPVIMITGHGTIELTVKTIRDGAYDFLEKPLSMDRVILTVSRALEKSRLENENLALKSSLKAKTLLVGSSPLMADLKARIEMAAASASKVLITGESGSGKELAARLLHYLSPRGKMSFVEINCAAIPQELIESELFGHEKGAFTGAAEARKGKFELADKGSLFLDEVGDMSLATQAKVLRAIETQEFQKVGGSRSIKVDVRLIAATNKDLAKAVKKGEFREDLYYRINVIPIEMPPLRARREDIPALAEHFLASLSAEYGRAPKKISKEALKKLAQYNWPGNVRELRNVIERLLIMGNSGSIEEKDILLSGETSGGEDYSKFGGLKEARDAFEKDFILKKLAENSWNVSRTAEAIGVERSNLHRKIKSYGIDAPRGGELEE
ncbi:MAG: sigma-54 dependent transcriptional regulator [Nitrospiraceae bacterium]|nr:sigma-54 dependent transcriptional regulator [Nitrospiraceae bacterium]